MLTCRPQLQVQRAPTPHGDPRPAPMLRHTTFTPRWLHLHHPNKVTELGTRALIPPLPLAVWAPRRKARHAQFTWNEIRSRKTWLLQPRLVSQRHSGWVVQTAANAAASQLTAQMNALHSRAARLAEVCLSLHFSHSTQPTWHSTSLTP